MSTWYNYNTRKTGYPKPYTEYAATDITFSGIVSDYDVNANTTLFSGGLSKSYDILIRAYDNAVTLKFNDSSNDSITMSGGESLNVTNFYVNNIYLTTTTAGNTTIKVLMLGW